MKKLFSGKHRRNHSCEGAFAGGSGTNLDAVAEQLQAPEAGVGNRGVRHRGPSNLQPPHHLTNSPGAGRYSLYSAHPHLQQQQQIQQQQQQPYHLPGGVHPMMLQQHPHYPPGMLAPVNLNDPAAIEDANVEEAKRASLQVFQEQLVREQEENMLVQEREQKRQKARRAAQEAKLAAYRLSLKYYESGSLEYSEPLVDGFYMLYGDFPELEEVVDANTKFPSLEELRRVPLYEGDVREVVFVDADQDSGLVAIQEKASAATCEAAVRANSDVERAFRRITSLAQVVVDVLGGSYDSEEMLHQMWQAESSKEKTRSKCIVIHLAHLPAGTSRHRALLFKVLADSLNLMCQLQRSRHSETEGERVVNVVQIDKKDYVVDLVYQPGSLEPLSKFVAQNPAFSHLRSGCQASTRYRTPVPPLPGPHPPSSLVNPQLQPPSRPSSSTSGSAVTTTGAQPVAAASTLASSTDPSKATRTQSADRAGSALAAVVGAALAHPAVAGAAQQPGSASQSRPSSGTPAPATPSPSHPSTPAAQPAAAPAAAAAVAAASPDSLNAGAVQDPSQPLPLQQLRYEQHVQQQLEQYGLQQLQEQQQLQQQQGQHHHHRQGRAESWDELAASRAMNQIATDLISLDEDDTGGAERGSGNSPQDTGWVTFGNNSFKGGQHLGAMLAAARNHQRPGGTQQQQQQQQQQQEGQAKQMPDSHTYQSHMQGGNSSTLQGSSGVASSASGGASDSPFANYLAMMSTGVQDNLSQPSHTCSPRAQNSSGLQSQGQRDSLEGSPAHMAHDPGGQGLPLPPQLPPQSSSTSSQDARGSGTQAPLSAALAQASMQRPNSHGAPPASHPYLFPPHHAHHQSLADMGLSGLSLGADASLRPGSLPLQRHQLLGAGVSALGGSISGSSQASGADPIARPRSNSWNQQQQQQQQQTPGTPQSPPAFLIGTSAPNPTQQPSPPQAAQLLPPHPSPPAVSGLATPPSAMAPPAARRAPAIAAGTSKAHHNKGGDEVFADLSPFPLRPPPPVPRLANSASMDRLSAGRAHPSGATSPGASSSSQQQQRQQLQQQQMNGPFGSNLQQSAVAGASGGAALLGRTASNSSSCGNLQGLAGEQADSLDSLQQQQQQQQQPIPSLSQASPQQGACVSIPLASPGGVWSHYGAEGVQATASTAAAAAAAANSQVLGGANKLPTYVPSSPIPGQLWTARYPQIASESGVGLQAAQASQAQSQPMRPSSRAFPLSTHSQSMLMGHPMLLGTSLPPPSFLQPLPLGAPPLQPPLSPSPFVIPPSSQPQLPPLYNPGPQLHTRPFLQSAPAGLTNSNTNTLPPLQYSPPSSAQPGVGAAGLGPPLRTAPLINPDGAGNEQPTANGGVGGAEAASQGPRKLTAEPSLQMSGYAWEIDPEDLDYGSGQRLGVGSYGEVYKGMWQGTEVAIKRFLDQNLSDAIRRDFKHEVQLMSRLRHPNIVLFLGAVIQPTQLAIVSEFVPRGSLFRLLHRSRAHIEPRRLLLMAMDIARGMNYLHSCRPMVVHRDLKSPNLLVDRDWTIKITDFGLSRVANATVSQTPRSCAGTPEWMAPEILRNEQVDEKSDVFSFGVILWELVTRKEPWEGLNAMQVVGAVGFNKKRLLIPDDLAPELTQLIRTCWEEQPSLRPSFKSILGALASMEPRGLIPSSSCIEAYAREHQMQ